MLASTAVDESTEKLRSGVEKSSASSLMIPASSSHVRSLQTAIHSSCATTNTSMTQQPSTSSRLLLVRVAFMTDTGTRLKTKGIPFPRFASLVVFVHILVLSSLHLLLSLY